jgi:hypothetical protein
MRVVTEDKLTIARSSERFSLTSLKTIPRCCGRAQVGGRATNKMESWLLHHGSPEAVAVARNLDAKSQACYANVQAETS